MNEVRKESKFDRALQSIERGREGLNTGIPIPFDRLRKYLPNIQQGTYYLIGAGTKVGKTSFADDVFYYGPYDFIKNNPDTDFEIDIDYFSYEISSEVKIIKGIVRKLWHDYGIITNVNEVLSRGENRCSQEVYDLVLENRQYFEQMEDYVTVQDIPENPTGIFKYLRRKALKHGTEFYKEVGKDKEGKPYKAFSHYVPHNPKRHWIIIIDHISLLEPERGFNTKQNIDKMSQYFVNLRNRYNAIPVVIQQLAFDSESDERHKSNRLTPTLKDFGDSKYTTRDANVIMTLFSPKRYSIPQFQNYDILKLQNTYRNLEILENRDGDPNINVGLNFIGPSGTFRELPRSVDMTDVAYHYASSMENYNSKFTKNSKGIWIKRK